MRKFGNFGANSGILGLIPEDFLTGFWGRFLGGILLEFWFFGEFIWWGDFWKNSSGVPNGFLGGFLRSFSGIFVGVLGEEFRVFWRDFGRVWV